MALFLIFKTFTVLFISVCLILKKYGHLLFVMGIAKLGAFLAISSARKTASVVQWSEFLATDTEVSGLIPGATRFSEQQWVWNGVHSGQLRSYLNKKERLRSRKQRLTAVGIRCADHVTPLYPQKLVLTSPTGGGCSVGIVSSRTKATEFRVYYAAIIVRVI